MQTNDEILQLVTRFPHEGKIIQAGRNTIKKMQSSGLSIAVKSFRKPNLINSFVYKYIRKSKAQRSFLYAHKLLSLGINTPKPIGFLEKSNLFGIKESYYACEHLENTRTLGAILKDTSFLNKDAVLEQYAAFMFSLHQKGIEFIDSTPGNLLLEEMPNGAYRFYLIDLNRMKFHETPLPFHDRMKNLSRLTEETPIMRKLEVLYSKFYKQNTGYIYQTILYYRSRETVWSFHKRYFKYQISLLNKLIAKPHC